MLAATQRFHDQVGTSTRWVTAIEYTNDGLTWEPLAMVGGSVVRSLSQQIHWTCDLTVSQNDAVNSTNTRVRIRHGIAYAPGDLELIDFGYYRVATVTPDRKSGTMAIRGESYESFVIRHRLGAPKRYASDSAQGMLDLIISEVFFEPLRALWREGTTPTMHVPAIQAERERWELVDGKSSSPSIANAAGARIYADASGGFVVIPVPTLADEPVFEVNPGAGGVLVASAVDQKSEGVANMMCVRGESTDGLVTATARVADNDPGSPTYISRKPSAGGFGTVPMFYTSPMITTYAQAERTAKAMLAQRLGVQQTITFDSLHHPLLEPGDVVLINSPYDAPMRAILDAVTYSLRGGPMSADTRTTRSSSAGEVIAITDEEGTAE